MTGCEGPEMVVVPAGRFWMGSGWEERDWYLTMGGEKEWADREQPRHPVRISRPFAMGKYPVTRGEFTDFVVETKWKMEGGAWKWNVKKWDKDQDASWHEPGFDQTDEHLVVCVSWRDAKAYADWLSGETGAEYRLPTEAEWEYACRAGTEEMRYWGNDWDNVEGCKYANGRDLTSAKAHNLKQAKDNIFMGGTGYVYTSPVGKFLPNKFGLHDMLGNVWEWCADCFKEDAYRTHKDYPAMAGTWHDSCDRVLRGGSWGGDPGGLRSASRSRNTPDYRVSYLGFRLARTLP